MTKHIYFVRHGESNANFDNVHYGPVAELTEKGFEQATAVGKRLKDIGIEALVSSSYKRTLQTAEQISKEIGLPVEASDLFVERRSPSIAIGKRTDHPEIRKAMDEIFDGYLTEDHRHSDEENLSDLRARANAALAFLEAHHADRICVVSHGIFLRVLFSAAFVGPDFSGADLRNAYRALEINNTGISHFLYKEDPYERQPFIWQIVNWNDVSHLS